MTLSAGTRLGSYEVLAPIGAGGMGEVYRARDTRLGREVAIKVLPDVFATDAERLGRLEREAQVLAALSHPNIATIFGLEESAGTRALVMELVDGPTLADIIRGTAQGTPASQASAPSASEAWEAAGVGPRGISINEALRVARQIADALEYAHERGIIHRDLKPANIKLTPDGQVKVLEELLYLAGSDLLSVPVQTTPTFAAGAPTKLVELRNHYNPPQGRHYDVSPDGQRFLFIKLSGGEETSPTATPPSITVVLNWVEELKTRTK